jgi:hypothetical protein
MNHFDTEATLFCAHGKSFSQLAEIIQFWPPVLAAAPVHIYFANPTGLISEGCCLNNSVG